MKILFLGTGADDWPKKQEAEMTEHDRRRCSLLIDEHILMDIAPPSYDFARRLGVDTSAITDVVISHMHGDHYNKECLLKYRQDTPHNINIWCHIGAVEKLKLSEEERQLFNVHSVEIGEYYKISDYSMAAYEANHWATEQEKSLHYIFDDGKKRVFYGCDGGGFLNETWEHMRRLKFDCMILDSTFGKEHLDCYDSGHNTFPMLRLILNAMKRTNMLLSEKSILVADHLSRGGFGDREEANRMLHEIGMLMAYDGMELSV